MALDEFLKGRVAGWDISAQQAARNEARKRIIRPRSQAGPRRPKPRPGQAPGLDMYSSEVGPPGVVSTYTFDAAKREELTRMAVRPPLINTMVRPQTVAAGMSRRSRSRGESLRQTVYTHFEL